MDISGWNPKLENMYINSMLSEEERVAMVLEDLGEKFEVEVFLSLSECARAFKTLMERCIKLYYSSSDLWIDYMEDAKKINAYCKKKYGIIFSTDVRDWSE